MAKLRRVGRRAKQIGAGLTKRVKGRLRKEQDAAFVATLGVSVLQGLMKKNGTKLPIPSGLAVNPELAYGIALCGAGIVSRGKSWEKTGTWLFYAGMPLFAIGARAVAAAGWKLDAVSGDYGVSGYNAGFRISEDDFDDEDPFAQGNI